MAASAGVIVCCIICRNVGWGLSLAKCSPSFKADSEPERYLLKQPYTRKGGRQISEIANGMIDPVLAKRAGINTLLLGSWDEIAGEDFADCTRPEKIAWPRRASEMTGEGGYQPGVLTIACEGARALFLTHAQGELIQRINGFLRFSGDQPDAHRAKTGLCPAQTLSQAQAADGRARPAGWRRWSMGSRTMRSKRR